MNEKLIRTFVSVSVPKQIISLTEMIPTLVTDKMERIQWNQYGNIHLTLKFIGHTPPGIIDDIKTQLDKAVSQFDPMNLVISGTGCFPVSERPRVLWLGLEGDIAELLNLVLSINQLLEPLGFPKEEKPYIPHITIGRIKYPPKTTPDIGMFLKTQYNPIEMKIDRLNLMCSELLPTGAVYSKLKTHFLRS